MPRRHDGAMITEQLYRDDAYLRDCSAQVLAVNDPGGIVLDRTVCYAASGGQPGDTGVLAIEGALACPITAPIYAADRTILHVPESGGPLPRPGPAVLAVLDWNT